jgi:hypothetical protein
VHLPNDAARQPGALQYRSDPVRLLIRRKQSLIHLYPS